MTDDEKKAATWVVEFFTSELVANIQSTMALAGYSEDCRDAALDLAGEYMSNWRDPVYAEAIRKTHMDAAMEGFV